MLTQDHSLQAMSGLIRESGNEVRFKRHDYLVRRGGRADSIFLLQDGWAARYSRMADGRQHISHFYLPGDLCDLSWLVAAQASQAVIALTPVRAVAITRDLVEQRLGSDPAFAQGVAVDALWRLEAQTAWMVTLGRRPAAERLAQLVCELYLRSEQRGKTVDGECAFPLSQQHLADYTGMSAVHVCRTLRWMRGVELLELRRRRLRIPDLALLASTCGYPIVDDMKTESAEPRTGSSRVYA
ncbi:Crp/Fnr family transcriptional regulator [Blastomonas sp.]|uniref:Crp/Fnr family transcriptional regulator n=1 Tax=Blastomonas sp. TaxID=1909299 RepID=UPI00262A9755|nr:Crp/Fnr family transcriptional regulator [Blastomonas sp.]MDM7955735.1 Crp/Fnr family transcriptional regulator [Blastomonas sp.]